jgi:phosphate acetyltransferase
MRLLKKIISEAQRDIKTIVLPESGDIRTVKAAAELSAQKIANVVLLGVEDESRKLAGGLDLSGVKIIDSPNADDFNEYAEALYEMRKSKGLSKEDAAAAMKNPLYYGVMMVKMNAADGMVAGAVNSTPNTLRPALQILRTAPGVKLVSSFFLINVPDSPFGSNGSFVFADCGLIENPDAEGLAEIAVGAANSFKMLIREEPIVAMLSYSTHGSAKSEQTQKVIDATALARKKAPELTIDGELQLDAAIVPEVGLLKAPGSTVAGRANVLIFPDLNSANIGYKLVQRFAKAEAYGPLLQGIAKPLNDLSRGCSAEDIMGVAAITAVQAQYIK